MRISTTEKKIQTFNARHFRRVNSRRAAFPAACLFVIFSVQLTTFADSAYQFAPDPKSVYFFQIEQSSNFANDTIFNLKRFFKSKMKVKPENKQENPPRKNGFVLPLDKKQVALWIVFFLFVTYTFVLVIPVFKLWYIPFSIEVIAVFW